jgi:hypothetical protein
MLYDAACLDHPDPAVFEPSYWEAQGGLQTAGGGRGTIAFLTTSSGYAGCCGIIDAAASWLDSAATCISGRRATHALVSRVPAAAPVASVALPVPQPVAARYVRTAWDIART